MSSPAELPALLGAMSAEEVESYLAAVQDVLGEPEEVVAARVGGLSGGTERLLSFLAEGMAISFRPERAEGETGLVQFRIETDDELRDIWLDIATDGCRTASDPADPDTVITMPLGVFLLIAYKRLSGADAYMDGLVRAAGDVVLATTLDDWFDAPDIAAAAVFSMIASSEAGDD